MPSPSISAAMSAARISGPADRARLPRLRLPHRPEFGPAMQQDQRRAVAALGDMGGEATGFDEGVLEGWHDGTLMLAVILSEAKDLIAGCHAMRSFAALRMTQEEFMTNPILY